MIKNTGMGIAAIVIAFSGCFVLSGDSFAQEPQVLKLSLDEIIGRALETNEDLKIKDNNVVKGQSVYREARSGLLPHINANASWTRNTNYPGTAELTDYQMAGGISASQLLFSFGRVGSAVSAAKQAAEAARFARDAGKQDVVYAAKLNYYAILLARDSYTIAERSYKNVVRNKELLSQRSYGGRTSKYEILKMDADLASRVPTMNDAQTQLSSAQESLKRLIGAPWDASVELNGEFGAEYPQLDYGKLVSSMYEREPSLKALKKSAASAKDAVTSKKTAFLPTLSAYGSIDRKGGLNGDHRFENDDLAHYRSYGLKASVPLWEGGQTEAQLAQAVADKNNAVLKEKQAEGDLMLELKKAYVEYCQYQGNLKANNEAVRLAEESFEQMREMFSSGQVTLTDLNNAELLLTNQRLNRDMTLYYLNITLAKISRLTSG